MTTAPAVDEREHVEVFKVAIDEAFDDEGLGSLARCYSYDEVPGTTQDDGPEVPGRLPNIFVLVSVERTYAPPRRLCAKAGRSGWRVSFRCVGRTVRESQWAALKVIEAVEERRFLIDEYMSGPITHESSDAPRWSNKRFSGTKTYTYEI